MPLYTDNRRDRFHCVLAATLEGQRRLNIGNFTATMAGPAPPPPGVSSAVLALAGALDPARVPSPPAQALPTFFMSEHLPNLGSRITLDPSKVDALGMPRVKLDWAYSRRDLDNLERAIAGLAAALGATNLGRVCWPVPRTKLLEILSPSRHHIGTTRMSPDRDGGVVDTNCRLHGCDNLYVAGTSTFPTSGIANPTLTLIALTMRLSDHLKRQLGARP
jgi:choline dehydrogenase-like flavoprotein